MNLCHRQISFGCLLAAISLFSVSCALFRPPTTPDLTADLVGVDPIAEATRVDRGQWWETFDSPSLNRYVEAVLAGNPSVLEAWARLRRAEAEAAKTGAARWPILDLGATASMTEREGVVIAGPSGFSPAKESYTLGFTTSYEVDLWGRIRSLNRAARLTVVASEYDRQTAMLSLAATAVETWYSLVAQREQLALLEAQLESNRTTLDLIEFRFARSLATALDWPWMM